MKQFKTTSLADQVFEKLENDIIQGYYPKGEILTELKLVEQLGVSRTPIREAMRRLEQEHLIEDAGGGALLQLIGADGLFHLRGILVPLNVSGQTGFGAGAARQQSNAKDQCDQCGAFFHGFISPLSFF